MSPARVGTEVPYPPTSGCRRLNTDFPELQPPYDRCIITSRKSSISFRLLQDLPKVVHLFLTSATSLDGPPAVPTKETQDPANMTDGEKNRGCVSTPSTPATKSTCLGLWTYAQRFVIVSGLLSLLCTANYFLGALAYNDLDACVDCFVAASQRDNFTEAESMDAGVTLGGMSVEGFFLSAFTWFAFQDKNRTRTVVICVCGLLNVLQRLVLYLEQSGEITRSRIGQRCFLWAGLSFIHVLAFSAVCLALNRSCALFHLQFTETSSFLESCC